MATKFSLDDEKSWPVDTPSYVFLRRAVKQLGKVITGDDIPAQGSSPVVIDQVHKDLIAGVLESGIRDRFGGEIEVLSVDYWHTEDIASRFKFGLLNGRDRFDPIDAQEAEWGDRDQCWIYVSRDSLDRRLASLGAPMPKDDGRYLSPYIRLMIAVSDTLGITQDNQPSKDLVEATLVRLSKLPGYPPLSKTLREAAATLIRDFESQAGIKTAREKVKSDKKPA
ncbi:hypothetical protein BPNPMPFG_005057 [Mesorhizobium sp. AR07]|uniref:hypothetical protein n=1 Tax=Mesorhizobium sp. AR07 TaxID=2865838 RepID=UPI00215F2551|nr:hypothetical protein [Mesorhizobium sp. AR07]UVK43279.1 hypothetical protein BPNPMPFG_005057 [Mesorhizobium sp. AR07]